MPMTISEFVTKETQTIIGFAATWRKLHESKPEVYPLELGNNFAWFKQYMSFCATKLDRMAQEEAKKKAA